MRQQRGGGDCRCQVIGENKGPAPTPTPHQGSPGAQVGWGQPPWGNSSQMPMHKTPKWPALLLCLQSSRLHYPHVALSVYHLS